MRQIDRAGGGLNGSDRFSAPYTPELSGTKRPAQGLECRQQLEGERGTDYAVNGSMRADVLVLHGDRCAELRGEAGGHELIGRGQHNNRNK